MIFCWLIPFFLWQRDYRILLKVNIPEQQYNIISDLSGSSRYRLPDIINDSTYLFNSGYYSGRYYPYVYANNRYQGIYRPVTEKESNPDLLNNHFYGKKFDSRIQSYILLATISIIIYRTVFYSKDFGKTFTQKEIPDMEFGTYYLSLYDYKISQVPNIYLNGDRIVMACHKLAMNVYVNDCWFYTYDRDFNLVSSFKDTSIKVDHIIDSKDTNSFTIHCLNLVDSTCEIKRTTNKGQEWQSIRKYTTNDSLVYWKRLNILGRDCIIFLNYDKTESINTFEIYDLEESSVNTFYSYKITNTSDKEFAQFNGITSSDSLIYLAINDTLFYFKDIFDKSSWQYHLFPDNGRIIRTFGVYGDRFYARYEDDNYPAEAYWIEVRPDTVKPLPEILSEDMDFGKRDINQEEFPVKKVKIYNNSEDAGLLITDYTAPVNTVFSINLPEISEDSPLQINPGEYFEFEANFIPDTTGIFLDSIVFYSNSDSSDNVTYLSGEGN